MLPEEESRQRVDHSASERPAVVAVVGLCGTGKSEAVRYLEGYLAAPVVYFGGVVLNEVRRRGLAISAANERTVRESIRATGGMDAIARLAAADIESALTNSRTLVIDGLYSFAEYELLKAKWGAGLALVAIHSARRLRYVRMGSRKVRPLSAREVDERDLTEIKNLDKGGPIAIADFHIINDATVDALHAQLADAMREIGYRRKETTA